MDGREKQAYVNEIKYQIKMLNNLKGWLRNLMVISSVALLLILFGGQYSVFIPATGAVVMAVSVIGCIAVGLGLKNGRANVNKLISYIEK
ncbi:hypothetical protein [Megamonas hypermegale]|uniref:hypothetical protein n=1 Tax=Megamonas hypermegale TaxID=158847 RepID=UPI0026E9275B|nr:hypothetical protein [Megamonas hypermegale]